MLNEKKSANQKGNRRGAESARSYRFMFLGRRQPSQREGAQHAGRGQYDQTGHAVPETADVGFELDRKLELHDGHRLLLRTDLLSVLLSSHKGMRRRRIVASRSL